MITGVQYASNLFPFQLTLGSSQAHDVSISAATTEARYTTELSCEKCSPSAHFSDANVRLDHRLHESSRAALLGRVLCSNGLKALQRNKGSLMSQSGQSVPTQQV